MKAQKHGADYVAFATIYTSATNPLTPRAPLNLIASANELLDITVIAIGGITLDNTVPVFEADADVVISAL